MKKIFDGLAAWARNQGSQSSTWRGLVLIASAIGYTVTPDRGEAVIAMGLAVSGLIAALTNDTPAPPAP